ncbi:hypothetical protein A2334_01755 [Candidatus Roizmanbacteria bacterium RIFOXYB2_FULL_38_10]|uniref:Uncharacterized protein n=1 Tax=Candidatus Roizmanbacteria bacterium RIFOXYD1_FULL_38_12 TaxID=1802093 RepID=A0A1F7L207_9BACT|nr:MAG: hypothetical protein A3K47_04815 [Candidatus Roizmanbacteria bacterium RIFOXYA2_FULL_38_14]OGK64071.1 MAG: hypothetical protein A3K27_04815 [Candidatus Roizmanbacteria bacterium RIFOXYA1_FULL_37_12]OGK65917.1 MAG: hypothetical protein A3K38_04815 [Candidatus Roizmanbacteria bacterium RIFOXYB1_FULL_40_23]OGK68070.1 MAG: hypothetical protein A2334_01755 [Candidatus Roizmanbacteria bacterium RIFOXYB2_FULL_38_10]OGK70322.1 MAG: hypothetical protein A3K21_04820 [Candidatus Roizmanbacteria ba
MGEGGDVTGFSATHAKAVPQTEPLIKPGQEKDRFGRPRICDMSPEKDKIDLRAQEPSGKLSWDGVTYTRTVEGKSKASGKPLTKEAVEVRFWGPDEKPYSLKETQETGSITPGRNVSDFGMKLTCWEKGDGGEGKWVDAPEFKDLEYGTQLPPSEQAQDVLQVARLSLQDSIDSLNPANADLADMAIMLKKSMGDLSHFGLRVVPMAGATK